MTEGKCKAPWCKNEYTGPEPSGYCCFLHRELHNFEIFNDELDTEEVNAIKREWRSLYNAILVHHHAWNTAADKGRQKANRDLWRSAGLE